MGALVNGAKFATDTTSGGYKDQALAALIGKCRAIITDPASPQNQIDYARAVLRTPLDYRETAAWVVASDANVNGSTTPTEAAINSAAGAAWPYLVAIGSNP